MPCDLSLESQLLWGCSQSTLNLQFTTCNDPNNPCLTWRRIVLHKRFARPFRLRRWWMVLSMWPETEPWSMGCTKRTGAASTWRLAPLLLQLWLCLDPAVPLLLTPFHQQTGWHLCIKMRFFRGGRIFDSFLLPWKCKTKSTLSCVLGFTRLKGINVNKTKNKQIYRLKQMGMNSNTEVGPDSRSFHIIATLMSYLQMVIVCDSMW